MQILSASNSGIWQQVTASAGATAQSDVAATQSPPDDLGASDARRRLSEIVRSRVLIVLAGSGTSMCIRRTDNNASKAPSMQVLWDGVRRAAAGTWDDVLRVIRWPEGSPNDVEELLSRTRAFQLTLEGTEANSLRDFVSDAEKEISRLCDFVADTDDLGVHQEFLRRLTTRSSASLRPRIFTTNYDLAFEKAASNGRFIIIDGFSLQARRTFEPGNFQLDIVRRSLDADQPVFARNVVQLFKIHGSVDWERDASSGEIIRRDKPERPILIYPRSDKYQLSYEQPYLEMMAALQSGLREPDAGVLVTGFGFRDRHIAEPLLAALKANLNLRFAVCDPSLGVRDGQPGLEDSNEHLKRAALLVKRGDQRIALISCKFEELVSLLPDLTTESDRERHEQRTREVWRA